MSNKIGEMILKYRKGKNLNQQELADLAGITRVSVGNYERGTRKPNAEILNRIAEALGVSIKELVTDVDPISKEEQLIRNLIERTFDHTIQWALVSELKDNAKQEEDENKPDEHGVLKAPNFRVFESALSQLNLKSLRSFKMNRSAYARYDETIYILLTYLNETNKKSLIVRPLKSNLEIIKIDNDDLYDPIEELTEIIFHQLGIGYDHTLSVIINSLKNKQNT